MNITDALIKSEKWNSKNAMNAGKGTACGSASSSGGRGGAIASGTKTIGSAIIDAGKEAVDDDVTTGVKHAAMNLI